MSTSISRLPASRADKPSRPSRVTMQCVAPVDVNTTSLVARASPRASMVSQTTSTSGNCAASASARSMPRLSSRARRTPLEARCVSNRRDMVPAPTMVIEAPSKGRPSASSARMSASSEAALEMDTAPLAIEVSARTRLPAATATLRRRESTFLAEPPLEVACEKQALTCDRICPSPTTRESRPEDTRSRCQTASSPESMKRLPHSVPSSRPERALRCASTSRMAALRSADTRCSSKRLQVDRVAASCTAGQAARSAAEALFHSASGTASFSRTSTVAVWWERPITRGCPGPARPPFLPFLPCLAGAGAAWGALAAAPLATASPAASTMVAAAWVAEEGGDTVFTAVSRPTEDMTTREEATRGRAGPTEKGRALPTRAASTMSSGR
mmetsp:Transcript_5265/g.17762  ORF Transcript_5265/g.17762 Transcript_5265/m.17762 type:complete len:386 (+) Transcript_5265:1948-3105(+)